MTRSKLTVLCLVSTLSAVSAGGQTRGATLAALQTRAERSDFTETSRYDDVWRSSRWWIRPRRSCTSPSFGYTFEGRPLPLAVVGKVADARPETVRASGRLRVYIQANIHAGEVEGKEAALALVRDIARRRARRLARLDGAAREPDLQRRRQREGDADQPRLPARPDRRPGHAAQRAGAEHQPRQHQARHARGAVDGAAPQRLSIRT